MNEEKQQHIIHPLVSINISDEELEESALELLNYDAEKTTPPSGSVHRKREGFIYVSKVKLYFSKQRLHLGEDWSQTHTALQNENLRMPLLPEFRQYLRFLDENSSNLEYKTILDEITQVRPPWRGNWIDAFFEERTDGFYILTKNKTKPEKLQDYLMEDRKPGIDFHEYLYNDSLVTSQGLPKPNFPQGDFYYWQPRNERVARFYAYSARAGLYCGRSPTDWYSSLGVYACAEGA